MRTRTKDKEFMKRQYKKHVAPLKSGGVSSEQHLGEAWQRVCQKALRFDLRAEVEACQDCGLRKEYELPELGRGNIYAPALAIVREHKARNFRYQVNSLLDRALDAVGIIRGLQYETNLVRCRPSGPTDSAIVACSKYLEKEIQIVRPKVILGMGQSVVDFFGGQRGDWVKYGDVDVFLTHAISDIVQYERDENTLVVQKMKRELWSDLKTLVARYPVVCGLGLKATETRERAV